MRTPAMILAGAAALGTAVPVPLAAQPPVAVPADPIEEAKNAARELADKGYEHFEAGEYQKAIQLFHQADERFHAPTLVLMQAHAQMKMGNLLEARGLYQRVVGEALPASAPKEYLEAHEEAAAAIKKLIGRTGFLKIVLTGGTADKIQVMIDGVPVPPSRLAQPIELNPGARKVIATIDAAEGGRQVFQTVNVKPGRTKQVQIAFRKGAVKLTSDSPQDDDEPVEPQGGGGSLVPAVLGFSLGAAGIGVGAVTGALWLGKRSDINDRCPSEPCLPEVQPDIDAAKTLGTVSIIGFVAGGVGLGLGTILLLTRSTDKPANEAAPKSKVSMFVGPGSIALKGTF